ncbi:MAG: CocE/NonD family hydrolase C-terminal non-catalytic domain-containing protein, partial [Pseudomonadota bacterium]
RILGYPTVNLTFSSDAEDEDLFVFVTQVDPSGQSYLLSEGMLRASRRTIGDRPYDALGLPMPSLRRADIKPLSGSLDEPADLSFTLSPIAVDIPQGHRVRVDIQASEGYALDPIVHNPPSKRSVWLGGADGSFLELPISEIEPN